MQWNAGPTECGRRQFDGKRRWRFPSARQQWLIAGATALACWVTMRVVLADGSDSGWEVTPPNALANETELADPAARIAIDHVLGQSHVPLLISPQPGPAPANETRSRPRMPRLAQQPLGVDGWRSAGGSVAPVTPLSVLGGPFWPEKTTISKAKAGAPDVGASPVEMVPPETETVEPAQQKSSAMDLAESEPPDTDDVKFRAPRVDSLPTIKFGHDSHGPSVPQLRLNTSEHDVTEPETREFATDDEPIELELAPVDDARESDPSDTRDAFDLTISDNHARDDVDLDESANLPVDATTELDAARNVADSTVEGAAPPENSPTEELDASDHKARSMTLPPKREPKPPAPLTRPLMNLRGKVRNVLKGYYRKSLNSRDNDPWEVMHGMLAYELHSRLHQGGPRGKLITSIGWLCYNKPCKGLSLLYVSPEGELRAKQGVGLQGHKGQLLAMLAQCRVSPEYPIRVGSHQFTIQDLIEAEMKTCYPKTELTFKLIALTHYLDLNDTWVNDEGLDWSIPRLIREELAQPIRGAACGGTHRLSGLTLAVKARERRGEPLDGEYLKAAEYVEKYEQYAFRLQNRDGSLSTRWLQGSGDEDDIDRRIKTTGHILEWLVYSLTDEELRHARTIRAVNYLATLLYENYDHEWEIGPRSHAIHALVRYDERVFKPFDGPQEIAGATGPSVKSRESRMRRAPNSRR